MKAMVLTRPGTPLVPMDVPDPQPGPGHHKGRRGRDVEGMLAVAAGAAGIDQHLALAQRHDDGHDVAAHRLGAAGDLLGRLALHAQRGQIAADLRRRGRAVHDDVHGRGGFLAAQVLSVDDFGDGCSQRHDFIP